MRLNWKKSDKQSIIWKEWFPGCMEILNCFTCGGILENLIIDISFSNGDPDKSECI